MVPTEFVEMESMPMESNFEIGFQGEKRLGSLELSVVSIT